VLASVTTPSPSRVRAGGVAVGGVETIVGAHIVRSQAPCVPARPWSDNGNLGTRQGNQRRRRARMWSRRLLIIVTVMWLVVMVITFAQSG
jgi:hypothetical protein